jgi:antitoxin MazE
MYAQYIRIGGHEAMNTTIQKWGNSLALRIPSSIAKDLDLHPGASVQMSIEGVRIIVKPHTKQKPTMAHLLKGVTKANRHSESFSDCPVGREIR